MHSGYQKGGGEVDVLVIIAALGILLLIDIAVVAFGADSREQMQDDHQRRLPGGI